LVGRWRKWITTTALQLPVAAIADSIAPRPTFASYYCTGEARCNQKALPRFIQDHVRGRAPGQRMTSPKVAAMDWCACAGP